MAKRRRQPSFSSVDDSDNDFSSPKKVVIDHEVTISKRGGVKAIVKKTVTSVAKNLSSAATKASGKKINTSKLLRTDASNNSRRGPSMSVMPSRAASISDSDSSSGNKENRGRKFSLRSSISGLYSKLLSNGSNDRHLSGEEIDTFSGQHSPHMETDAVPHETQEANSSTADFISQQDDASSDGYDHFIGMHDHDSIAEDDEPQQTVVIDKSAATEQHLRSHPLQEFLSREDECLQQFVRLDLPDEFTDICAICKRRGPILRCRECFGMAPCCQECMLAAHRHAPLHRIEYFNEYHWVGTTLADLGLVISLGHGGHQCPGLPRLNELPKPRALTVIDDSGIQEVMVAFCCCEHSVGINGEQRNQLLAVEWFPATGGFPRTVMTFRALKQYEILSLQSKISGHDYYQSLVKLTCNDGSKDIPRRYEEFMRICREYDFIKMVQRAGKWMTNEAIRETREGELALDCPACPQPGINIPANWRDSAKKWLYSLFIMLDANFHMKLKARGFKPDPELGPGFSYFVEDTKYMEHLAKFVDQRELNYCDSGFRAIDHANLRNGKGYLVSGVIAIQCRHMFMRKNGLVDLQRGEKQANMDWAVYSTLRSFELSRLVVSYDIACQYSVNFRKRFERYEGTEHILSPAVEIEHVIPMFHIMAHGSKCQTRYSFHFRPKMARTDGENIERGWANINPMSMPTKEMGKGSRHDTLNWHFQGWNYVRLTSLGPVLANRYREALNQSEKQREEAIELEEAFPQETVIEIKEAIEKWNEDPANSIDPYFDGTEELSMTDIYQRLEEEQQLDNTLGEVNENGMSAEEWLKAGIELEDLQRAARRLNQEYEEDDVAIDDTQAEEENESLGDKITSWKKMQRSFMPGVPPAMELSSDSEETECVCAWDAELYLPSSLDNEARAACPPRLIRIEIILREQQARLALEGVRKFTRTQQLLTTKKWQHVSGPGQKKNTRASVGIQGIAKQKYKHVRRYRAAREALLRLDFDGSWKNDLQELLLEHVKLPSKAWREESEGRRKLSWIWKGKNAAVLEHPEKADAGADEGLRVEYAKALARAERWGEEVELVREEMRRVLMYLNWRARKWIDDAKAYEKKGQRDRSASVYANRQANVSVGMATKFREMWIPIVKDYELPRVVIPTYITIKRKTILPKMANVRDESGRA